MRDITHRLSFKINLYTYLCLSSNKNSQTDFPGLRNLIRLPASLNHFFVELDIPLPEQPKNAISKFEKLVETLIRLVSCLILVMTFSISSG
jgi:hypothetical protein